MAYQYSELSSQEFEALATRIFCRMRGSEQFQLFQVGPDRGIDGVVVLESRDSPTRRVMIQAKNHRVYRKSVVLADLEKFLPDEFDEYVLAHAASLSEHAVGVIRERFKELYGDTPITVLGQQTIEQVLKERENRGILESFPKLFLNSLVDLDGFIQRDIWEYSHNKVHSLESQSLQYVETQASRDIAQLLAEERVCIVAGPAGIGKTVNTFLAAQRIIKEEKNSGLIELSQICFVREVRDIYKVSPRSNGVIFIFDDFLGDITLNRQIPDGNFRQFVEAINKILHSEKDRLVYISRDYILKDLQNARGDEKDSALFQRIHQLVLNDRQSRLEVFAALTAQRIRELSRVSPEYVTESFKTAMIENREYEQLLALEFFNPRALHTALKEEEALNDTSIKRLKKEVGNPLTAITSAAKSLDQDTFLILRALFVSNQLRVENLRKLQFSLNVDYRELLRALDGIWVNITTDHYLRLGGTYGAPDQIAQLANPTVKEFLAGRFLSTKTEINYSFDVSHNLGEYTGLAQAVADADKVRGQLDLFATWTFLDLCVDKMERNELNLWSTLGFRSLILWAAQCDQQNSAPLQRFKQQLRKQALDPATTFLYEFEVKEFRIVYGFVFHSYDWSVGEAELLADVISGLIERLGSPDEVADFRDWFKTLNPAVAEQMDLTDFIYDSEDVFLDMLRGNWETLGDFEEISNYVSDYESSISLLGYGTYSIDLDPLYDDFILWQERSLVDNAISKDGRQRTLAEFLESERISKHNQASQSEREETLIRQMFE